MTNKKVQRNLYVTPRAVRGWGKMADLVNVHGQRDARFSPLYDALGQAFAANPEACAILVRLILDGRMAAFTERPLLELFDHE